jgi:hypothetical protein
VSQDNTAQWPPPPPPYRPPPPYQPPPPRGGRRLVGAWQLEVGRRIHPRRRYRHERRRFGRDGQSHCRARPGCDPVDGRRDGHGTASIARCSRHRCDGGGEQSTDLVSSSDQPDARVWRRLGGGHHRQERVDEHRQDGPPVPGAPAAAISPSRPARHRSGSTLRAAATARSSVAHTPADHQAVAAPRLEPTHRRSRSPAGVLLAVSVGLLLAAAPAAFQVFNQQPEGHGAGAEHRSDHRSGHATDHRPRCGRVPTPRIRMSRRIGRLQEVVDTTH